MCRFLWVSLQIENLCDSSRIKVEGDLVDELARLPRSLADMYSLLLENIDRIEQRGRTIAKTVLKWLLCTKDASSRATIAACSKTTSSEHGSFSIPDVLDVCSTLVIYDEALDRFQFAHLSIREFLESQPDYDPSEANRSVLEWSLQRLIDDQSPKDPFRSYAIRYWDFHYCCLNKQQRKEVFELHTKRFLFNGTDSSDFYNTWVSERSWEDYPVRNRGIEKIDPDRLKDDFRKPADLASCLGWLEILEHVEASHTPEDFQAPAKRIMKLAVRHRRASVVRWLVVRNIYPTEKHLKQAFGITGYSNSKIVQTIVQTVVRTYLLSFKLVDRKRFLATTSRYELEDMYQFLVSMACQDQYVRTPLSQAYFGSSDNNSKVIGDLLLEVTSPIAQCCTRETPLSLWMVGEHQPIFNVLLLAQLSHSSEGRLWGDRLRRILNTYYYHYACLLVHYKLDSILENVDMRKEWTDILQLIATLSVHQGDASASPTRWPTKLANTSQDPNQWVYQTLLSVASLFRHKKAFQVLLDWGVDPRCPTIYELRKQMMSSVGQMGHSMSVQALLAQEDQSSYDKISDELTQGPLAWAAYTGNLSLVQSILDRGLDPNIKNRKGQTALYFAAQQTEDLDPRLEVDKEAIVRLLLQKGALVTSADAYNGASVLANAFKGRYSKVAKLLLDHGVKMPKGPINGPMEPLVGAYHLGHEGIRQTLLERAQDAAEELPRVQWSSSRYHYSGDRWDIAAQLILGGTMRVLGDFMDSSINRSNS